MRFTRQATARRLRELQAIARDPHRNGFDRTRAENAVALWRRQEDSRWRRYHLRAVADLAK